MVVAAMKHMASNFSKLDKFKGVDFRRWQKKMHLLLSSMRVVYVLTTPIPEDGGDDATVEQLRKRTKWDNDDYVCRGLILNVACIIDKLPPSWKDFKHTLKHLKEDSTLVELGSHLLIEESLKTHDSDKLKGNNVVGPQKPGHLKKDCKDGKVGNKANGSGTNGSVDGSTNSLKGQNMLSQEPTCMSVIDNVVKTYESLNDGSILHMRNESTPWWHGVGCGRSDDLVLEDCFRLNIINDNIGSALMSTSKLNDSILWHARLGHVYFKRMQDMSKDGLIPAFNMDTKNDLCDLHANPSLGNKKYFVTFIDDASRTESRVLGAGVRLPDPKLKTLGERGIKCIFVGYVEHSKAFRFYVIEPNKSVSINSIIESKDAIFDENRFSSIPRLSLRILNGTKDIGGLVVPQEVTEEDDPKTFDEAMKSQDFAFWKEAINDEMDSIIGNNTWVLADLPPGKMVIQGFRQKSAIDYFDTYALVARISTKRLLIAMASIHNLIIHQIDVKTAFLNGELDEDAPKQWHQKFDEVVLSNGYLLNQADKCVYSKFDETVSTPIDTSEKLMSNNGKAVSQLEYSRVIGCLMYAMTYTRPDIAFVVVLEGYIDASWISNIEDNSSTSGWVFLLGGGVLSWASKKQSCITGSTMESEFGALAAVGKEAEWLKNFLLEILLWSKPISPISICCDSATTLAKTYSQMYNGMSRHLGVTHSMIRELIMNEVVSIEFVRSQRNLADHLTKGLARDLVLKSAEWIGLKLVSMHVFDKALNWYEQFFKRFGENVTWEMYETDVKKRFDLVFEDPMVELKNLRQTTSVKATIVVTKSRTAPLLATPKASVVGGNVNKNGGTRFRSNQIYSRRHKCSGQLYSLEAIRGLEELEEDRDVILTEEGVMNTYTTSLMDEPPLISLNALSRENTYRTIRVRGYVRKNVLHVLVDSRTTHNFLDLYTTKKLGCRLRKMYPLEVSVANGHVMTSLAWNPVVVNIEVDQWMQWKPQSSGKAVTTELSTMSVICYAKQLPPKRTHDHKIPLMPNTPPVNIRPYKHPPSQKYVVELMVKELLESRLNKSTVKDKFPVPVVEELISELSGSKFFSKLNLSSGYHQIRMNANDAYKTTFRTHMGIMSFYQSLESHPGHLRQVLTVMRSNSVFAKRRMDNSKQLRGLHGLTGYYRKFIRNYAVMSRPLTALLKENAFQLSTEAQTAFETLKTTMIQAQVLALPNFNKTFTIETDALGLGIGAVLLTTPFQAKWLPKLLGFDYEIFYKSGMENVVADALLRVISGVELNALILTYITTDLLQQVKVSWANDVQVLMQLHNQTYNKDNYTLVDGILRRKGKIVVGSDSQLKLSIIHYYHANAMGDHSGTTVTLHRLKEMFYWKGMQKMVKQFVKECDTCQREKVAQFSWKDSDIGGSAQAKQVCSFHCYATPLHCKHNCTSLLGQCVQLHGSPDSIVSDRDKIFLSHFWQSLFKMLKVQLKMSTAYHPQTDGQTEIVNKCLESFLRCMNGEKPKEWVAREESLHIVKFHLERAQDRMISHANKHRSDIVFEIVGAVVYKLELPPNSQVHPVFHVSQLKLCKGSSHKTGVLPHCGPNGLLSAEPIDILDRKLATEQQSSCLLVNVAARFMVVARCMVDAIGDGSSFVVGKKMKDERSVYLDHGGATLYSEAIFKDLISNVYGNPRILNIMSFHIIVLEVA
ncbi:zinc finger, CCHC-type containing protein [Tanacetum coccineum]|uniref:Zinc finger, CCHC-type containing protein n=1 Tax=Tanacetum coccineum TaxID=301880 RepID=A0ABQ5FCM5_9ASTR